LTFILTLAPRLLQNQVVDYLSPLSQLFDPESFDCDGHRFSYAWL
jgi:hypothetical protein